MSTFINEQTVMQFYIDCIDDNRIAFLSGRDELKSDIRELVDRLMKAETMNSKIQIAVMLWKKLFEASMSYISPDKRGYDKVFKFFDAYVEFEELIFASDSFYRDHTLHCIWVYFLGEYVARKPEFDPLFADMRMMYMTIDAIGALGVSRNMSHLVKNFFDEFMKMSESVRCVSALTHDLGYPLKKIGKINKSISKVLPFFAVSDYSDFHFDFGSIQAEFINSFVDFISRELAINFEIKEEKYDDEGAAEVANRANSIFSRAFKQERMADGSSRPCGIDYDAIAEISDEDRKFLQDVAEMKISFSLNTDVKNAFLNDFENYQHGIMSAYLLTKNLAAFQLTKYNRQGNKLIITDGAEREAAKTYAINLILSSISVHTNDLLQITALYDEDYLTLIDELEEFSRISRASQNREYVKEFCESAIDMTEDGWLDIRFVFKNSNLDNLDPEISFKGRCKRFLSLFNIAELSENLKIRITCVGELPNNHNIYEIEIARHYADIRINGESQNIPKYLKSAQFFTKEEYARM